MLKAFDRHRERDGIFNLSAREVMIPNLSNGMQ